VRGGCGTALHRVGGLPTGDGDAVLDTLTKTAKGVPPERVEELRRNLPPPVVPGTGQKTHGRWIAPDGKVRQVVSGRDEWSGKVNEALTAEGCPRCR